MEVRGQRARYLAGWRCSFVSTILPIPCRKLAADAAFPEPYAFVAVAWYGLYALVSRAGQSGMSIRSLRPHLLVWYAVVPPFR